MTLRTVLLSAVFLAAAAGCYTGSAVDTNRPPGAPNAEVDGTEPDAMEPVPTPKETAPTGLPCDVADLLEAECNGCHGATLSGGAPNRLMTWEDLAAPSEGDPSISVAELALSRMKSTRRPMPPEQPLPQRSVDTLEKWIESGMPKGSCREDVADLGDDGEPTGPAPSEPKEPEPPPPSVCSSGVTASPEAEPSPLMKPGAACISCHSKVGGPSFEIAGTVYKTLHEPNDCNGMTGVKILVIDATGATFNIPVNEAGNFTRITGFAKPYRAMVVRGNKIREMKSPQTEGDCNSCHTERGAKGAPGRIMAP